MKTSFLIALFLIVIPFRTFTQTNYNEYSENDKLLLFNDDFNDNKNNWGLGNVSNNTVNYAIENGYLQAKLLVENGSKVKHTQVVLEQTKDWEIELRARYINGLTSRGFALTWGFESFSSKGYFFFINAGGKYQISKDKTGQEYIDYIDWTTSTSIKATDWNKLTIRKINNKLYFFINQVYIHSCDFESFFGNSIGFMTGGGLTVQYDYLRVSYLNKQAVITDNTGPEINLYQPYIAPGTKVSKADKQIFVKGNTKDKSGVYEVTINGVEVPVNANGDFQQNVKLAVGDNTITIKSTDIKNNTTTYTFYIKRLEAVNNEVSNEEISNNEVIISNISSNEKRLALIIGNANYGGGQSLKNPASDANLMASTLQNLGFEVIKRTDANKVSMEQAIREFSKKLPNYNIALFYYAGHGVQVDGLNYLIPTDAKLNDKSDCKFEAISVNFIVEEFEKYPDNVNVVILDACRNDPFRSWARGGERGFKAIAPTSGTIIAFATSEGATASDGSGANGLFTEQLVKQMYVAQPIESVFKKTRVEVEKVSNGSQSPQEWSKLKGDFYFKK